MKLYRVRSLWAVFCRLFLLTLLLSGCAAPPPVTEVPLVPVDPGALPAFVDHLYFDGLEHSIDQSLAYLERVPDDRTFTFGAFTCDTTHMRRSLERFRDFIRTRPSDPALSAFIAENYLVFQSIGKEQTGEVLFTGYYEPLIQGRREKDERFRYPLYSRPDDLVTIDLGLFSPEFAGKRIVGRYHRQTVVPYYERRAIELSGVLEKSAAPLAWVEDPVDLFFLQIQGSGKIELDDGSLLNVHYHASNGRPYRSIGKLLIDQGKIAREEMSMQKIRQYLKAHPEESESILHHNPSYIFFKLEADGPLGFLEVKLTPGRSLALDRRIFPWAALAYIETQTPLIDRNRDIYSWIDFSGFALNQDTGGAIRGPARADLFWGNGPYAEITAGHMQHSGRLYFLVLKPDSESDTAAKTE